MKYDASTDTALGEQAAVEVDCKSSPMRVVVHVGDGAIVIRENDLDAINLIRRAFNDLLNQKHKRISPISIDPTDTSEK